MEISKRRFTRWLNRKADDAKVGIAEHTGRCPIARFMKEEFKVYRPSVQEEYIHYNATKKGKFRFTRQTPTWAATFIDRVDSSGNEIITAHNALRILKDL